MEQQIGILRKQVRVLKLAVTGIFLLLILLTVYVFVERNNFSELNVERLNIVEADGTVKLVLSNKERQHPGRMNGKDLPARVREAGLIFFNGDGDECGGLVYDNDKETAGMVYSIDKFRDDQVMQLQYNEQMQTRKRKYGLQFWSYGKEDAFQERYDRYMALPAKDTAARATQLDKMKKEGLLPAERLFVGKSYQDDIGIFIKDEEGRAKIKLFVDSTGNGRLEFFDDEGKVRPAGR